VLIGEPGVGRPQSFEGIALRLVHGDVQESLQGKAPSRRSDLGFWWRRQILAIRGAAEGRLQRSPPRPAKIIVFLDE